MELRDSTTINGQPMHDALYPMTRWLQRLAGTLLLTSPFGAFAAFPEKPITVVAPFGVGSVVESTFRVIMDETSRVLGQPIIMENRPGALSRLGVQALRKAAPDGYTLSIAADTLHVQQPILDPSFKLRPGQEYAPVSFLFSHRLVFVANPKMPFQDMKGMIAYSKANPGALNIAVSSGSATHFSALMVRAVTGADLTIVPYKSQNDFLPDLMSGRVQLSSTAVGLKPQVDAGQLVALATTGPTRWNAYAQAPTMKELGYDMLQSVWYNLIAPAGTPPEIVSRVNLAIRDAMKTPAVVKKLNDNYLLAAGSDMTPAEFIRMVDTESAVWAPILRSSGVTLN